MNFLYFLEHLELPESNNCLMINNKVTPLKNETLLTLFSLGLEISLAGNPLRYIKHSAEMCMKHYTFTTSPLIL